MGDMEPIISMITTGLKVQQEGQVMRAVQEAGVYVDKERLIKALEDARTYWEEGYRAALADRPHGRWVLREGAHLDGWEHHYCTRCDTAAVFWYLEDEDYDEGLDGEWQNIGLRESGVEEILYPYCPNCGAKMDEEETVIDAAAPEKERVNECEFCKTEGSEVCLNKGNYNMCELCWEDSYKKCSYYERAAYCRRCGRKLEEAQ